MCARTRGSDPRVLLLLLAGWGLLAPFAWSKPEALPELEAAREALQRNFPDVAARKLERLEAGPSGLDPSDRVAIRLLRLEALVRSGQNAAAVELAADPLIEGSAFARFWKGMALAQSHQLGGAATALAGLSQERGFPFWKEAALTRATVLEKSGETGQAIELLRPLLDLDDPGEAVEIRLQLARLYLSRQDIPAARECLGPVEDYSGDLRTGAMAIEARLALLDPRGEDGLNLCRQLLDQGQTLSRADMNAVGLDYVDALIRQGRDGEAAEWLWEHFEAVPDSPLILPILSRLPASLDLSSETVRSRLESWASDGQYRGREWLARYWMGLALIQAGKGLEAMTWLKEIAFRKDNHPGRALACIRLAQVALRERKPEQVLEAAERIREVSKDPQALAYASYLEGRVRFREGAFVEAAENFGGAAVGQDVKDQAGAAFNAALAALQSGDEQAAQRWLKPFSETASGEQLSAELMLERALYLARESDSLAFDALKEFTAIFPDHPKAADADVALAELYLNQFPPKPIAARESLEVARQRDLSVEQQETLDYVAIWVEERAGNDEGVIEKSVEFLEGWPESPQRGSVSMKLGEVYFRAGDYANAITYFEKLVEERPDSKLAETALFFAAKAASLILTPESQDKAMLLWGRVAALGGDLAAQARREQGLLKLRSDDMDEALAIFESILQNGEAVPRPLRMAVLCDKGHALFLKAAAEHASGQGYLQEAVETFQEVLDTPDAGQEWDIQAGVRLGKCYEKLGLPEAALKAYTGVIRTQEEGTAASAALSMEELDWYFRAGFAAIHLFQVRQKWKEAVELADQLARSGGERSVEANRVAERLRLKHFIVDW